MAALGFAAVKDSDTLEFRQKLRQRNQKSALGKRKKRVVNPDSPFAELRELARGEIAWRSRRRASRQARLRIDKWLWHARFFKSRTLSAKLAASL